MTVRKFAVGQSVRFSPDRNQGVTVRGGFKVVRLLPGAASILQYRVKSQLDGHECVVAKTSSRGHEGASTMPTMSLKVTRPPSSAADHRPPELVKPLFRGNGDTDYLIADRLCLRAWDRPSASLSTRLCAPRAGRKTSSRLTCEHNPAGRLSGSGLRSSWTVLP